MTFILERAAVSSLGYFPLLSICSRASWRGLAALEGALDPIWVSGRTYLGAVPPSAASWVAAHVFGVGELAANATEPARRRTLGAMAKVAHNGGTASANSSLMAVVRCASTLCLGDHWGSAIEAFDCLRSANGAYEQLDEIERDLSLLGKAGRGEDAGRFLLQAPLWGCGASASWSLSMGNLAEDLGQHGLTEAADIVRGAFSLANPAVHELGRAWAIEQRSSEIEDRLLKALEEGEGRSLDFKRPMSFRDRRSQLELCKDIAALSNTPGGGELLIGVNESQPNRWEPVGLSDDDANTFEVTKICDVMQRNFYPLPRLSIRRLVHLGRPILQISVSEFTHQPLIAIKDGHVAAGNGRAIFREGDVFVRTEGAQSKRMGPEEFGAILKLLAGRRPS